MPSAKEDGDFAKVVLAVASRDQKTKHHLSRGASKIYAAVIMPLLQKYQNHAFKNLSQEELAALNYLSEEHSSDKKQWGGLMPDYTKAEILADPRLQKELLEKISHQLSPEYIESVQNPNEIAGVAKCVADCSFCYVECYHSLHSSSYSYTHSMIFPTKEELAIRVSRAELDQGPHLATSYGIEREVGVDVVPVSMVPEDADRKHIAGKSFFAVADVNVRARLVSIKYEIAQQYLKNLELSAEDNKEDLTDEISEAKKTVAILEKQMNFYFPRVNGEVKPTPTPMPMPMIQRLAVGGAATREPIPLIASASGTSARALIALQDLGGFDNDENHFDPEAAQYVSSLLCGAMVHGGHHSVLEVGDVYNRLIDCKALADFDAGIRQHEENLGYYRIGDSTSLLPLEMRKQVEIRRQQQYMKASIPRAAQPSAAAPAEAKALTEDKSTLAPTTMPK